MDRKDLVDLLRAKCEGKTQAALAKEIGVSAPYVSDIFNGRRNPDSPSILRYLGLSKNVEYRFHR